MSVYRRITQPVYVVNQPVAQPVSGTVVTEPVKVSVSDHSQTISTTSVQVLPANPNRNFLVIQNLSSHKVWVDFNQTAVQGFPSLQLTAGQSLYMESTSVSVDAINAIAEVSNTQLIVKEG